MAKIVCCAALCPGLSAQWVHLADAPWSTRGHHGAVTTDKGTMLVAGGMHTADNTHLNDVWSSGDGVKWTQITDAAPWAARHRHGMLFLNGCTFVFGGTTTFVTSQGKMQYNYNDVWKSCDEGQHWNIVTESAPWSPREGFAFTVAHGKMLMIGGTDHDVEGALNEVWGSEDGLAWEMLSSNETSGWGPRYATTAMTTSKGDVILAGGFGPRNPDANATDPSGMWGYQDVWASTDGGKTWEQRSAQAEFGRRVYLGMTTVGDAAYIIGGQAGIAKMFQSYGDIWVTDDGSEWKQIAKMPTEMSPRGAPGIGSTSDGFLVLGGTSEINPHEDFNDVWQFTPSTVATSIAV